jgi:CRP-like cAMP-binding protein
MQWVGEEIVVVRNAKYPFSAIARTKVTIFELSKADFLNRLPKEYI